jgi:hypothetical protein
LATRSSAGFQWLLFRARYLLSSIALTTRPNQEKPSHSKEISFFSLHFKAFSFADGEESNEGALLAETGSD